MKDVTSKKISPLVWIILGVAILLAAAVAIVVPMLTQEEAPAAVLGNHTIYWNVDGESFVKESETGLSTREPDASGVYRLRMVSTDGTVELTTVDKKLVNMIDAMQVVALELDGNEILNAEDPSNLGYVVRKGVYVQSVSSGTVTCNSSIALNGMPIRVRISDALNVLDVRADAQQPGENIGTKALEALDYVFTCADAEGVYTHVFLAGRSPKGSVYWRATQQYSSSEKATTRVPDENGVYTLDFFCDGQLVQLKCKDKTIVNKVDSTNRFTCHFAFEFDEEGYIIKSKLSSLAIKGMIGCSNYVVTSYEQGVLVAKSMSGSEQGNEFDVDIDQYCEVYDVSKTAQAEGRQGQRVESLRVGDRIVLWTDVEGVPVLAYVTLRLTDVAPQFNMERKWSSYSKQTLREPDKKGWYYFSLLESGSNTPKTYKTKDKALADLIDSRGDRTVGIRADGDEITAVYEAECIFGYTNQGPRYVTTATGAVYSAMAYKNASDVINGVIGSDCKIFDVSGTGKIGAETTLREGDLIIIHRNPQLESVQIYVTKRAMGVEYAYYNLNRQYDSEKKVTTRQQDENGYYVFEMANQGKIVTVKTKSKELANQMDAYSPPAMGLVVKNGVVQYAFDPIHISGALRVAYFSYVTNIAADGTVSAVTSTDKASSFLPAKNCVYYNCSQVYEKNRGEQVSGIKIGDLITGYLDRNGEATVVFILSRDTGTIAWNPQRMYSSATGETTRQQDADGYYVYELLIGSELKTVKTKDKTVASKIDSYDGAFGLVLKGDVVTNAVGVGSVKDVKSKGVTEWDVVELEGSKLTLMYTKPGSDAYTGKDRKETLAKNLKVYDVSPTAEVYGKEVQLQLGDRVRTYINEKEQVLYAYVVYHATRVAGIEGYCDHCGQNVHWEPWTGGSIAKADRHYYLNCDVTKGAVTATQATRNIVTYETVIDLNGYNITIGGSRFVTINAGQTLTMLDSVGGGRVTTETDAANGGVFSVQAGATLNLMGGIYSGRIHEGNKGSVAYVVAGGKLHISGGVLDGSAMTCGKGAGSTIYSSGDVVITGGEVKGASVGSGGSIYMNSGNLTISGGKIHGGQAANYGDEIFVNHVDSVVTISGGEIAGQLQVSLAKSVTLSGTPKIGQLKLVTGKVTLGQLTSGAKITVAASGAFTETSDKAESYQAYFTAADSATYQVLAVDGALCMIEKTAYYADCVHCGKKVLWYPWKAAYTESGHYFLDKDASRTIHYASKAADMVIDLHGKNFTTTGARAMMINSGITVSILDSVGGGTISGATTENGGVFSVKGGGTLNFYSGTAKVSSAVNTQQGSIAYVMADGTLNLYGGILDASAVQLGKGACGAIYSSGVVTIAGGEVKGASVGSGGSIYVADGKLTISGGKIHGGQAANYGDDIFVSNADSAVTISGGEVSGQFQISLAKTVTLSGAPKFGELKLGSTVKLTLGALQSGADITVSAPGVFTEANASAATYVAYFHAKDTQQKVVDMGDVLTLIDKNAYYAQCDHCNTNVLWMPWKAAITDSGHYFLEADVSRTVQYSPAGADMVLDLKGHTFTATNARAVMVKDGISFTLLNTGSNGKMVGGGAVNGGVFSVQAGGSLKLMNVTLQGEVGASNKGSVLYVVAGGTVDISGNTVMDGDGAIYTSGAVNMSGGTVKGDTGVYVSDGSLTLSGGQISGLVHVETAQSVTVSGAPKIGQLKLVGAKLTLGDLQNGASIAVEAAGAFSLENPKAKSYLEAGYIFAFDTNKTLEVTDGGVLYLPEAVVPKCLHCNVPISEINWQVWNAATALANSGHYYLTATTTRSAQFVPTATDVVIDLRGFDFVCTKASTRTFLVNNGITLTVMDTVGSGTVSGLRTSNGSAYNVQAGGTLNLYGGTAIAAYAATNGSVVYVQAGGTLNIGGTAVVDGSAVTTGSGTRGTIYSEGTVNITGGEVIGASAGSGGSINIAAGDLTISGGLIHGGQAANYGDDIFVNNSDSVVTISGGEVSGQFQISLAKTVTVSGAPKLANLKLGGTVQLTLGQLETNAQLAIAALGAFTKESANAKAYLDAGYFTCATAGKTMREENGVLIID